jgi:hypothetical protein
MKKLINQRDKKLELLHELGSHILMGSASETYRTCGNPGCRCHSTGPKHGPHMYVSYKGEEGRTTGYYVPVAWHETVRDGLAAWKEVQATIKEIAQLNKAIMDAQREQEKKIRKGKPKGK